VVESHFGLATDLDSINAFRSDFWDAGGSDYRHRILIQLGHESTGHKRTIIFFHGPEHDTPPKFEFIP